MQNTKNEKIAKRQKFQRKQCMQKKQKHAVSAEDAKKSKNQ